MMGIKPLLFVDRFGTMFIRILHYRMDTDRLFIPCISLITVSVMFTLLGLISYCFTDDSINSYEPISIVKQVEDDLSSILSDIPPQSTDVIEDAEYIPPALSAIENHQEIRRQMGEVILPCSRLIIHNEYRVFLTAYCAEECGWNYWTSDGTYCHRADWVNRYAEPTTCAIDLSYFCYGTMFYVPSEDRVYIAEDTGPGVRGMWIDTYQDDMSDVYGYNTRYETVYTCEIEYYTVQASNYDIFRYISDSFIK